MTDSASDRTAYENQREVERAALRKVRAALAEIAKQEPRASKFALAIGCLVLIVLVVASVVALTSAKHAAQEKGAASLARYVENRIRIHLTVPPGVSDEASTFIELTLSQAGAVTEFNILKSSGTAPFDEAIRQAVSRAGPFGPIPLGYANPRKPLRLPLRIGARRDSDSAAYGRDLRSWGRSFS